MTEENITLDEIIINIVRDNKCSTDIFVNLKKLKTLHDHSF